MGSKLLGLFFLGFSSSLCFADPILVWVEKGKQQWIMNLTGHPSLAPKLQAVVDDELGKAAKSELEIPRNLFPAPLPATDKIEVLTSKGLVQMNLSNRIYGGMGCGDAYISIALKGNIPKTAAPSAIGILSGRFPPTAKAKDIRPIGREKEKALRESIWKDLLAKDIGPYIKSLTGKDLQLSPVKMGLNIAWIVWIDATLPKPKDPDSNDPISFGFAALLDAKGKVIEVLSEPSASSLRASGFLPKILTDIDSDGFDEVLGSAFTYESSSERLISVKQNRVTSTVLHSAGC